MTQFGPREESTVVDVDLVLRPKCITCGNSRTFYVVVGNQATIWSPPSPMPAGSRIYACGRCRSRHSVIVDYSD